MLGQDTEFFVFNVEEKRAVPAHSVGVPQKKTKLDYYGSFFRDGYAVEFNTNAATCRAGIWENLAQTLTRFQKRFLPTGYTLISDPVVPVDLSEIDTWPDDLKVLGCNPTYDPYKEERKEVTIDPLSLPFRTSGAHLHYSFGGGFDLHKPLTLPELGLLAKYCDLTIGLINTVIFGDDKEFHRRSLYGSAGEFRNQKYPSGAQGLEYRVLSPRLYNHPGVFGLTVGIFKYMLNKYPKLLEAGWNSKLDEPLQQAINTGTGATELLEELDKFLKTCSFSDTSGMAGLGYIPNDWGAAMLKLRKMRLENGILDKFQMGMGQTEAHWGWSEYNDHTNRSSTVQHKPLIVEEAWRL